MPGGELWRGSVQIGKQVVMATAVPATRKMYFRDPVLTRERESRAHRASMGRRDNVFKRTNGPETVGGSLVQAMSADEIIELALMAIKGGVTPTQPDAGGNPTVRLWTFKPDPTLDFATVEWHDGARPWQAKGCMVNSLNISGGVGEETLVTADVFGLGMVQNALTGALSDRTPTFIEGWETKLYIDALGGTPGTTNVAGTLMNWDITVTNNLVRQYFADNTLLAGDITTQEMEIDATLTFRASQAVAATEFANWEAGTERIVSVEFGNNQTITGAYKKFVRADIPGGWTAFDLGGNADGMRTYELSFSFVYDSVLAAGFQLVAQNNRATAF